MKDLVEKAGLETQFHTESAANSAEEIGNPVYPPAHWEVAKHGSGCAGHVARKLRNEDYEAYDLLIRMDRANIHSMYRTCGGDSSENMHLLTGFTDHPGEAADPWYTGDFAATWRDVEEGCRGLLRKKLAWRGELCAQMI